MLKNTLQYALHRAKNHVRVHVTRRKIVEVQGKKKEEKETVGSFKLYTDEFDEAIFKNLTPEEKIELRQYLYSVNFAKKHFNEDVGDLGREIIKVPQAMQEAAKKLGILAEKNGISYNAYKVMIEAYFKELKSLEKQLNKKLGKRIKILESLGVAIND